MPNFVLLSSGAIIKAPKWLHSSERKKRKFLFQIAICDYCHYICYLWIVICEVPQFDCQSGDWVHSSRSSSKEFRGERRRGGEKYESRLNIHK